MLFSLEPLRFSLALPRSNLVSHINRTATKTTAMANSKATINTLNIAKVLISTNNLSSLSSLSNNSKDTTKDIAVNLLLTISHLGLSNHDKALP